MILLSAADWTGVVEGDILTLTSVAGPTAEGENITVTFTGTGNPWIDNSGGLQTYPLLVIRNDGYGVGTLNFSIETGLMGGLTVSDGVKITETTGTTSPVITITGPDIARDGTIIIDITDLHAYTVSGNFTTENVVVEDTAVAANWTGMVTSNTLTLTSTEGDTTAGENVTVSFTGAAGNPWVEDSGGDYLVPLKVTRGDGRGAGTISFGIWTVPQGGLSVANSVKITAPDGTTTPVITITHADIARDGTVTINVTGLNAFVASGNLTPANIVIDDTAATANWTATIADGNLTLTSADGVTAVDETVTVTFTGAAGNRWVDNSGGNQTIPLQAIRNDTRKMGNFSFVIDTGGLSANFTASLMPDIAPLTVIFYDISTGSPTAWNWDFGDGDLTNSTNQHPIHTYMNAGIYSVNLTVTNARGTDTRTKTNYIEVLNGAVREANTSIEGLTVTNCGGPQTITVDISVLPAALTPNSSVLEIRPPADRGLNNITIYAMNGIGFSRNGNIISRESNWRSSVHSKHKAFPGILQLHRHKFIIFF